MKAVTLKSVLDEIENKTDYKFLYEKGVFQTGKMVSISAKKEKLSSVLNKLLKTYNVSIRYLDKQIIIKKRSINNISKATTIIQEKISGFVFNEEGLPLPGATVLVEGTTNGVSTDFDGKYTIDANSNDILVFSFVGFITQKIKVRASSNVDVILKRDVVLDEIIVVAYGTTNKEAIIGSVSKIRTEDIEKRTVSNISTVIEGATPGVIVNAPSGQPGSGQSVRIRGFGSFGSSNAPLYVVDGIPINGALNTLNASDIESVTILKDAGSTALYGNKAANGVILITTKKGKSRKGEFKVNYSTAVVSRGTREYDRLAPKDFYEAYWEARRNAVAIPGVNNPADVDAANISASAGIFGNLLHNPFNVPNDQIVGVDGKINPKAQLQYPEDLDWEKAITRAGIRTSADMSFNRRSENGGYFASLSYLDEEGYIINTDFDRITARVNGDFQATPWLKVGLNLAGAKSKGNQAQTGPTLSGSAVNPFRFTRNIGPIYPIHAHNQTTGAYILDSNGNRTESLIRGSGASSGRHIVFEIQNDIDLDERNRLDGKAFFELKLAKGLKLKNNLSYEVQNYYNTRYRNPIIGDGAPNADASRSYIRTVTEAYNQLLSYETSFNSIHNLDLLIGHENQNWVRTIFEGSADHETFQGNIELVNFSVPGLPESNIDEINDESYFGRLNYNFDKKYYLSASIRTDGNSRFARDKRWGAFWSLGGAWSINREKFIEENISWIDNLKLRASYGHLGNANLGIENRYAYQPLFALNNNNQFEPGIVLSSLGNVDLVWEKSIHTDVALEFSLFNRLRGSVEYYNKISDDLIFPVPLPLSAGGLDFENQHAQLQNVGELFNRGIEASLSYDVLKQEDFNWTMTINASTLKNEVTKLPEGQDVVKNGTKQLEVGRSIFDYYINDWYGVDPADGSGLFIANNPVADDVRTIDGIAVTPNSNNAKKDYLGSVIPDVYGMLHSNFRYKNFSLGFLFTYQIGGDNLDNGYRDLIHSGNYGASLHSDLLNRWRQPGDITDQPRVDATFSAQWDDISDRFLVDASFLSLRQVNMSYNLPDFLMKKIQASAGTVYINGENLFNINARRGFNQQQRFNGNTSNIYVPSRLITIGLNLTF